MKKNTFLPIAVLILASVTFMLSINLDRTWAQAQPQLRQSVERKFEEYRKAIKLIKSILRTSRRN